MFSIPPISSCGVLFDCFDIGLSFDTTAGFVPLVQRLLRVSRIDAHDARAAALKLLHDEKSQVSVHASQPLTL